MEHQRLKARRHHKLKPLRYGPYIVLQQVGPNADVLDFFPRLGIHDVVNLNSLKRYEPPLLEESIIISHPTELVPDFQPPLLQDTILDSRFTTIRNQQHYSYLVGRQGQTPACAHWYSEVALRQHFLDSLTEVGTLSGLNREELGSPDDLGAHPKGAPPLHDLDTHPKESQSLPDLH